MFRFKHFITAILILLAAGALCGTRLACSASQQRQPGNVERTINVAGMQRHYRIHIPRGYDPAKATPVVLAFHGATDNIDFLEAHCGLDAKSESAGFIVVYPEVADPSSADTLHFNTSFPPAGTEYPDDVAFTAKLLNDLPSVVNVDPNRIFACGISNGGMMCYRLAAELSDRIAAIAPVAATMGLPEAHPQRPVPIIAFHGTADPILPFYDAPDGPAANGDSPPIRAATTTIAIWAKLDGCPPNPKSERLPTIVQDGTSVTRETYAPGKAGAEVIFYIIENGGHTWPGTTAYKADLGLSSQNISADDQMWQFFLKHPLISSK